MSSSKQRRRMDAQIFRLKEKTSQIPSTKCSVFMAGNKLKKSVFCLPQSPRIQSEWLYLLEFFKFFIYVAVISLKESKIN